jgi:hypothetical protein
LILHRVATWREEILNLHHTGASNGPTEGLNFCAKQVVINLLDDDERRRAMGELGRKRVVDRLSWSRQKAAYLGVYDAMTGRVSCPEHAQLPSTV